MWVERAEAATLLAKARDVAIVGAIPQALRRSLVARTTAASTPSLDSAARRSPRSIRRR